MKTFVVALISVLAFPAQNLFAQLGWNAYQDARTMMNRFNIDPVNNQEILAEAARQIAKAVDNITTVDYRKRSKVYLLAGEIYSTLATEDLMITQTIDPNHRSAEPKAAMLAYNSYKSALGVTDKGYEVNEALDGIINNINNMNAYASARYGEIDFAQSYKGFSSVMDAVDLLEAYQYGKPAFEDPATANEFAFAAGLSAINAGMNPEAKAVFMRLREKGYQNPYIYESLYRLYIEKNKEKAVGFLSEGRAQFPQDKGLLYTEINYDLQNNKFEELVSKLEAAIAGDLENVSLYTTLGFVFDNLFQRELEAENVEQSEAYFASALENYRRGLELDDKNADAIYSIGKLYFNKADLMTQELVAIEEDFSKEGIRKYEAKQAEILQLFEVALPYFQRAESLKPDDSKIHNALKEIYTKKEIVEDLEVSQKFDVYRQQRGESSLSDFSKAQNQIQLRYWNGTTDGKGILNPVGLEVSAITVPVANALVRVDRAMVSGQSQEFFFKKKFVLFFTIQNVSTHDVAIYDWAFKAICPVDNMGRKFNATSMVSLVTPYIPGNIFIVLKPGEKKQFYSGETDFYWCSPQDMDDLLYDPK